MKERNRFSGLLKHLMSVAKLKNYTLAKELQYDESYISKWVNGNLLPTEKNSEKILRDISRCICASLDDEAREVLYSEYQVDCNDDLEQAIFDNLEAEFNYVMDLKEATGSEIAVKTSFYPELTLAQFMQKIRHPVLRQVKALDVITALDIFSLDKNYQMSIAELENASNFNITQRNYPGVSFSMLMNMETIENNLLYNIQFLMNLLTNLSNVNFQLYTCPQALGKIIFAVKDAYSISGMLMDENHCMAVTASEDPKHCNALYDRLKSLCSQETLAVRRTTMAEMLNSNEYIQFLFGRNQRWILGHFTEHMVPDDLFNVLADEYCRTHRDTQKDQLVKAHIFSKSVLESTNIRVLCYANALNEFTVTGTLDFFNTKVTLTPEQRLRCLEYACSLYDNNTKLSFRMLKDGLISDIQHIPDPTMFLSDYSCFLRLVRNGPSNNLTAINKVPVCELFQKFFDRVWEDSDYVEKDTNIIADNLRYIIQMLKVQIQLDV